MLNNRNCQHFNLLKNIKLKVEKNYFSLFSKYKKNVLLFKKNIII